MSHRLVLVRHAKSDYPVGVPDHDRPLSARGRREAPLAGRWLAENIVKADAVMVSTATRTRETWALINAEWSSAPSPRFESGIYEASASALTALVATADESTGTLVMVGHNPGLEMLAVTLARRGDDLSQLGTKYPTSAIAVLEIDGKWNEVAEGCAELSAFVIPRD